MKFLFGLQLPLHFHSLELKFDSGFWTNLALNPTTNPQFLPSYLPSIHQLSASGLSRLCSSHSHLKLGFDPFFQLLVVILWLNAAIVWWIINLKKDGGTPVSTRWLPTFDTRNTRVNAGTDGSWDSALQKALLASDHLLARIARTLIDVMWPFQLSIHFRCGLN